MSKLLLLLLPLLLLTGCDDENRVESLRLKIEKKKLTTEVTIPESPELKQFQVYNYKNAKLKSPFRNSISTFKVEKKSFTDIQPDTERKKGFLESFSLMSVRMTGTIKKSKESLQAILETEDGKVYIVDKGDYVGRNNGKILEIHPTKVELEEIISNGSYRWQKRPATIQMHITQKGQ